MLDLLIVTASSTVHPIINLKNQTKLDKRRELSKHKTVIRTGLSFEWCLFTCKNSVVLQLDWTLCIRSLKSFIHSKAEVTDLTVKIKKEELDEIAGGSKYAVPGHV